MGAMPLRDTAGNAVEALVAHAVSNVPGAPASVEATAGDTQVTLAWTAEVPDGPDSGTDRSDERSYTVTGLDNGVLHTFEVRAVNVVGEGAPASPGSDGGSAVTEYQYRVSDDAGSTWSPDWTDVPDGSDSGADRSDERSYTVTGLDNGVLHTFEVRAVNVVGEGAPASATSTPVTVPEAPASLNATPGDTQATLAWTAAVPPGDTVTVDYTVPTGMGAMPLRDTAGNAVEALVAHAVPNVPGAPASLNRRPTGAPR
jgi:predicted phage tail protein